MCLTTTNPRSERERKESENVAFLKKKTKWKALAFLSGEEECIEWICGYRVQCLKVKTTKETLVKQSWKHLKRVHHEIRGTFNGSHHSRMAETVHKLRGKLPWIFLIFWITTDICQSRSFYGVRMIAISTLELSMPVMRLCLLTKTTCVQISFGFGKLRSSELGKHVCKRSTVCWAFFQFLFTFFASRSVGWLFKRETVFVLLFTTVVICIWRTLAVISKDRDHVYCIRYVDRGMWWMGICMDFAV